MLFRRYKNILGISVDDNSLELVALQERGKKRLLLDASRNSLAKGLVVDGVVKNSEKLIEILKEMLKGIDKKFLKSAEVLCSVPDDKVISHVFHYPKALNKEQIIKSLSFEIEHIVPVSLEDVYFDFEIIESFEEISGSKIEVPVHFAAVPKTVVDGLVRVVEGAGLKISVLEIEAIALARALVGPESETIDNNSCSLILDIGESNSTISSFYKQHMLTTSSVSLNNKDLAIGLARELKISAPDAQKLINEEGLNVSKRKEYIAIEKIVSNLVKEIESVIRFFNKAFYGDHDIKKLIICGDLAKMPGLLEYLSKELGLEVKKGVIDLEYWNVAVESNLCGGSAFTSLYDRRYSLAIGLVLRGLKVKHFFSDINLLPEALKNKDQIRNLGKIYRFLSSTSIVVLTAVLVSFVIVWMNIFLLLENTKTIRTTTDRIIYGQKFLEVRELVDDFNNEVDSLLSISNEVKKLSPVFVEIRKRTPTRINLEETVYKSDERNIVLRGVAPTRRDVMMYLENLEKSKLFGSVESPLSYVTREFDVPFEFLIQINN